MKENISRRTCLFLLKFCKRRMRGVLGEDSLCWLSRQGRRKSRELMKSFLEFGALIGFLFNREVE